MKINNILKFRKFIFSIALMSFLFLAPLSAQAEPVTFVDFSWESVQIHNRIVGFIFENAYDTKTDYLFAESMPGLLGLERGDIDVMMECWIDNFHEWWVKVKDTDVVHNSGKVFNNPPQGWYVPDYVIEGDEERGIEPMAPDLKSVYDLKDYWELFEDKKEPGKGRFYNGPSGWVAHTINNEKIKAYDLSDYFVSFDPGSQSSLAAAIASAYEKGEPIIAYGWEPTTIMGMYDMIILEEPPYDEKVWAENYGCGTKSLICYVMLNGDFARENPELTVFFDRYTTTVDQLNKSLAYMAKNNVGPEEAAIWFLNEYPEDWKMWVNDEEKISKIEGALQELK